MRKSQDYTTPLDNHPINKKIQIKELHSAIKPSKNSSSGPDNIPNIITNKQITPKYHRYGNGYLQVLKNTSPFRGFLRTLALPEMKKQTWQ